MTIAYLFPPDGSEAPSIPVAAKADGFPPLEALVCGTPVITSFTSSLPEITDKAAILIDPYNPSQLSLALEQILFNENLKRDLINRGL